MASRPSDEEYHQVIEQLAQQVIDRAEDEGWLTYLPDDADQTPLQQAINELARNLRRVHSDGDGCLEGDELSRPNC